jgi:MFS family permease
MFFVNGAVFANWVSQIPSVAEHLHLQPAALGVGLVGSAVGAVLALLASGLVVARFGSRLVTTVSALLFCAALPLPILAPNVATLFVSLLVFGAASSTMDVAMNTQAVAVERAYARPIMSSFHGLWSIGAFTGAVASGLVAGLGVGAVPHLIGAAVLLAGITAVAAFALLPAPRRAISVASLAEGITRRLLLLGLIAAFLLISEGSASDWSALYLRRSLGVSPAFATSAFAGFSLSMAVGRLLGDRLVRRFGARAMLRAGAAVVVAGFGASLLVPIPAVAIVGFVCLGAGLSNGIPIVFSAGGRSVPTSSTGIGTVATLGYMGFIAGPPAIGVVAQLSSLRVALGLIPLLSLLIFALAPSADPRREPVPSGRRG